MNFSRPGYPGPDNALMILVRVDCENLKDPFIAGQHHQTGFPRLLTIAHDIMRPKMLTDCDWSHISYQTRFSSAFTI